MVWRFLLGLGGADGSVGNCEGNIVVASGVSGGGDVEQQSVEVLWVLLLPNGGVGVKSLHRRR